MIVQSLMFSWSSFHQESDSLANMIQTVPESSTAVIMTRTVTLATYDHGDERANKILVSGKVLWLGLGHPEHLAGLGCSRCLYRPAFRIKRAVPAGQRTVGVWCQRLGSGRCAGGHLLCQG
jgi:hypothetical protein